MKKIYHRLAAFGLAAAALSSCSRSAYTFNPQVPAYLGTSHAVVAAPAPVAPAAVATVPVVAAPAPLAVASPAHRAQPTPAQPVAAVAAPSPVLAAAQAAPAKPSLAQRLVLRKVLKQVAKAESRQQNTAGVAHTAAKGASLTVAIIGLIALLVGIIANSGLVIVLGSIVLVVGLVLLLLSAL